MKLRLDAPDVNNSEFKFTVNDDGRIVYGLGAIKGVGEGPVEAITEARQEGPFADLFDFCARIDLKRVNKRTLDGLIRSGALDRLGPFFYDEPKQYQANIDRNRGVLLAALEEAIQAAEQTARSHDSGHADLFGGLFVEADADVYANHRSAKEVTLKERLRGEKETLGLYLTGHPIDEYEGEIRRFARQRIVDLKPSRETQTIAGLIIALRVMKNKRATRWASSPWTTVPGVSKRRCLPIRSRRLSRCCKPMRWWWWKGRSAPTTSPVACGCVPNG
jgi:DNA polymerase-3 subunit alpha